MSKSLTNPAGKNVGSAQDTAVALFDANGRFVGHQGGDGKSAYVIDPALAPDVASSSSEDEGVPVAQTVAFTGASATAVLIKFKQISGASPIFAKCHFVFNAVDAAAAAADLADPNVRRTLTVGDEVLVRFTDSNPCARMDYLSNNASADLALYWEYK